VESTIERAGKSRVLKNIRKHQNSTCLLLQKRPFIRVVNHIANTLNETYFHLKKVRYGEGFCEALQAYVESSTISILEKANTLAQHAKRDGVNADDVQLVL